MGEHVDDELAARVNETGEAPHEQEVAGGKAGPAFRDPGLKPVFTDDPAGLVADPGIAARRAKPDLVALEALKRRLQPGNEIVVDAALGEKHLAVKLRHQGQPVDGIWFGRTEPLPAKCKIAFRLEADEWQGARRVRFLVEGAEF